MIVCFGDSLTAGFQTPSFANPTGQATPYGHFLQELLGTRAEICVSGVCGEVTGEMVPRFRRNVLLNSATHVIILGGTNDLGWNVQPAEIMRNLLTMYELARCAQILPIPVTVPSIRVAVSGGRIEAEAWIGQHLSRRKELNRLISEYALSTHLPWIDLFTATAEAHTQQLAEEYSNDGLHLTTAGYRLFGQLLFEVFTKTFPMSQGAP